MKRVCAVRMRTLRRLGAMLAFCTLVCGQRCLGLMLFPVEATIPATSSVLAYCNAPFTPIEGSLLLSSLSDVGQQDLPFSTKNFQRDQVARILDANTIKLQKAGVVSIAGTRMPTPGSNNFQFPSCFSRGPTYKIRQLIPPNTDVLVKVATKSGGQQSALVIRKEDNIVVNVELIRNGFGKVQKVSEPVLQEYLDTEQLKRLQEEAQSKGLGIFQRCSDEDGTMSNDAPFEAQFEPLELTIETQWSEDGGRQILKQKGVDSKVPPKNPGDVKGCSDFTTYEDALRWFEYYKPFYGDVAKLDRNGDGIPCPGLPHTTNQNQYRMKVPDTSKQN